MSAVLRPPTVPPSLPTLSIAAGYCVAAAIREELGLEAALKWPNDVLVQGRKVCGILCEAALPPGEAALVVIGIGVNANLDASRLPPEVQATASSLSALLGRPVDKEALIAAILNHLEPVYLDFLGSGISKMVPLIRQVSAFVGEQVTVGRATATDEETVQGTYMGIDEQGRAIVETPGGERVALSAGDLSLRRAST